MRATTILLFVMISTATVFSIGCGGGGNGGPPVGSGGSGNAAFETHAYTSAGAWTSATLNGTAAGLSYNCTSSDSNCGTNFEGKTDSGGNFIWYTDALPAEWDVSGVADSNCPSGAESGFTEITNDGTIQLPCGQKVSGNVVNCTVYYNNGVKRSTDCPSTVTLTSSAPTYPTSYALDAGIYDISALNVAGYQGMASSSTSITVPSPVPSSTNYGLKVVTVWDPTNNQILAAAGFNIVYCYQFGPSIQYHCEDPD